MFFENLLEFYPVVALYLLEGISLIVVILFVVIFPKIFKKISGKFLLCFFAVPRLTDLVSTFFWLKKADYTCEENLLLRWILKNNILPETAIILLYNLFLFIVIYFLYKLAWNYSSFSKTVIKTGILTFSILSLLVAALNAFIYFNL